jgi:hypothetical protein
VTKFLLDELEDRLLIVAWRGQFGHLATFNFRRFCTYCSRLPFGGFKQPTGEAVVDLVSSVGTWSNEAFPRAQVHRSGTVFALERMRPIALREVRLVGA